MTSLTTAPETRLAGPTDPFRVATLTGQLNLLRDPLAYLTRIRDRFGPVAGLPAGRPRLVFALGADAAREVFTGRHFVVDSFRHLRLRPGSPMMLLTSGLLRLNGPAHQRHRLSMRAAFAPRHVAAYTGTILSHADDMITRWLQTGTADLHADLAVAVTRTAVATMAGIDEPVASEHLHDLMTSLAAAAGNPLTAVLQLDIPGTPFNRMTRIATEIEALLRELITRSRSADTRPDLVSQLVTAADPLPDDELIGELYTALCHDSVASTLFWSLLLLEQHRQWWTALGEEVRTVLGAKSPSPGVFDRMPVLDNVVKETMRLMPPASFLIRYATAEARLVGAPVPEGAMVVLSPFVTHRDPAGFADPLAYRPNRWLTDTTSLPYFPFGMGAHHCIGRSLATLEVKLVLSRIVQRCALALPGGTTVDPVVRISTVPANPVHATVVAAGADQPPVRPVTGSITRFVSPGGE